MPPVARMKAGMLKSAAAKAKGLRRCSTFENFEKVERKMYIRHKFDAKLEKFVEDLVEGEMEPGTMHVALEGAMRELYRMKIYTKWRGVDNYVAKKYREHVEATKEMLVLTVPVLWTRIPSLPNRSPGALQVLCRLPDADGRQKRRGGVQQAQTPKPH